MLSSLDSNSAMGPDGIHATLLKNCAAEVAYPVQTIFSQSLGEGFVPLEWRSSLVVPIYKKGPHYEPLVDPIMNQYGWCMLLVLLIWNKDVHLE